MTTQNVSLSIHILIILSSVLIILDSGSFPKVQPLLTQECLGPKKQLKAFTVLAEDPGLSSSTHRAAAGKKNKNYLRANKVTQQIKVLAAKPDKTLKSFPLTPIPPQKNKCKVFYKENI